MKRALIGLAAAAALAWGGAVAAEKKYGPGVSDTEIVIGQTSAYSGPASAYSAITLTEQAYFRMLNERGGVNGRKIRLLSLDDAYSPPKTVELTRQLVEQEGVLFLYGSIGTATNSAVQKYLNAKKVPQILIQTGASKWNDPKGFPWTTPFSRSYELEARTYAKYLLQTKPDAKVAILYQHDDMGRDYVEGFRAGLGERAKSMIVAEASYETSEPTIDSQIATLKASGADTFFNVTSTKFAAQAIRKVHDIGWRPLHLLANVSSSIGAVLQPAGLERSIGIISINTNKTPLDPAWDNDQDMKDYLAFMREWNPNVNIGDTNAVHGYMSAILLSRILAQCGDDLTRENVLRQATNFAAESFPMLLPGVSLKITPDNYSAFRSVRLQRFDGTAWRLFGEPIHD